MMTVKKGFNLLATIFILLIIALLTLTVSSFISSDAVIAVKNMNSLRSFYIASTGVEYYLRELAESDNWDPPPTDKKGAFSGGSFEVTTTEESKDSITFTVTGLLTEGATTFQRTIRQSVERGAGGLESILDEYVIYWGGGTIESDPGLEIANTSATKAIIIGDVFAEGDLEVGPNVEIDGDAYATGKIEIDPGSSVTGTQAAYVDPPTNVPSLESTYYDGQINHAATDPTVGTPDWSFGGITDLSGNYYIDGNVAITSDASIEITGTATIVATGNFAVGSPARIGDNLTVIAGGNINIASNVTIGKHGRWYSSADIVMGNNARVAHEAGTGEGTVFITPGNFNFYDEIEYYGFIYCGGRLEQESGCDDFYFMGNLLVGGKIEIFGPANLILNPDLVDIESLGAITGGGEGGEGAFNVVRWDEVY